MTIGSVLVVDDHPLDRMLLKRLLKKGNLADRIFECEDGEEALTFLKEFDKNLASLGESYPPDLIFLDINMPLANGFEFLEAFTELRKQDDRYQGTFVVMMSSSCIKKDRERALSFDVVLAYLEKGLQTPADLKDFLSEYCPDVFKKGIAD